MEVLGIDVGGSGIKGAPIETETGAILAERQRLPTPVPAKPDPVAETVAELARFFNWQGPIGCGFPSAIRGGVSVTAANIHKKWIGMNVNQLFSEATGCPTRVINDADAAGLAEVTFGAGRGRPGVIIMVTIGTGLGTALFTDGRLLPNAELGHIEIGGVDAETRASDGARKREDMPFRKWVTRFDEYLHHLEQLFWPDLFIIGGGLSKKHESFIPLLTVEAEVTPALLLNNAGIVGAALAAAQKFGA